MKILYPFVLTFLLFSSDVKAQDFYESVFPDLDGSTLSSALRSMYKPSRTLSYNSARDKLYGEIDIKNGKLSCIYTGYTITITGSGGVRSEAYNKGINCEHSWPQSKGATGDAKSDMHHLFPTRIDVNSDRGSLPFGEINDNVTDRWFKGAVQQSSIPSTDIDEYSELDRNVEFEPREDIKGDIARAAFYFKTMYSSANASFFNEQVDDLCQWHINDPVDEKEWIRNQKIAQYQGGKKNPFILDCSIARLYCSNVTTACYEEIVNVNDHSVNFEISPNPTNDFLFIDLDQNANIELFSRNGMLLRSFKIKVGSNKIDVSSLSKGIYFLKITDHDGQTLNTKKFIKL